MSDPLWFGGCRFSFNILTEEYNIISCPAQYGGGKIDLRKIVRKAQLRILSNCGVSTLVEDKQKGRLLDWGMYLLRETVIIQRQKHYNKSVTYIIAV